MTRGGNNNMKLARYMSLDRYKDLLSSNTLFFSRYDTLGDMYEGSLGHVNPDELTKEFISLMTKSEHGNNYKSKIKEVLEKGEKTYYHTYLKEFTYANCWHQYIGESSFMWKMYAQEKGVMIITDLSSLKDCLGINENTYQTPDRFWNQYDQTLSNNHDISVSVGKIKYVSKEDAKKIIGTDRYFHKQKAYKEEKEWWILLQLRLKEDLRFDVLRRLDDIPYIRNDKEADKLTVDVWNEIKYHYTEHSVKLINKLPIYGVRCSVDINMLIKEVIVETHFDASVFPKVKLLNKKYGISADVKKSEIEHMPQDARLEIGRNIDGQFRILFVIDL